MHSSVLNGTVQYTNDMAIIILLTCCWHVNCPPGEISLHALAQLYGHGFDAPLACGGWECTAQWLQAFPAESLCARAQRRNGLQLPAQYLRAMHATVAADVLGQMQAAGRTRPVFSHANSLIMAGPPACLRDSTLFKSGLESPSIDR